MMKRFKGRKISLGRRDRRSAAAAVAVFLVLVLAVALFSLFNSNSWRQRVIDKREFYFSTRLEIIPNHGNKMVPGYNASQRLFYPGNIKSSDISLYGGEMYDVEINVQNFIDETRISSQYDIEYTAKLVKTDVVGVTLYRQDNPIAAPTMVLAANPEGDTVSEAQMLLPDILHHKDNGRISDRWVLHVPRQGISGYQDGSTVTVEFSSSDPYRETITLNFRLYANEPKLCYSVTETAFYYELGISSKGDVGDLTLHWPEGLKIDDTNPLTYNYSGGEFNPTPVYEENSTFGSGFYLRVNNGDDGYVLRAGEHVSIRFYKDPDTATVCGTTADVVPVSTGIANPICVTVNQK